MEEDNCHFFPFFKFVLHLMLLQLSCQLELHCPVLCPFPFSGTKKIEDFFDECNCYLFLQCIIENPPTSPPQQTHPKSHDPHQPTPPRPPPPRPQFDCWLAFVLSYKFYTEHREHSLLLLLCTMSSIKENLFHPVTHLETTQLRQNKFNTNCTITLRVNWFSKEISFPYDWL